MLFSVTQICNNALINRGSLHTECKVNIITNWLSSSAMPIEKLIRELHESKFVRQKKGVFEHHASFVFYELLIFAIDVTKCKIQKSPSLFFFYWSPGGKTKMPNKDPLRLILVNIEPQITFNDESIFNSLHLRNHSKCQHNFRVHRLDGRCS